MARHRGKRGDQNFGPPGSVGLLLFLALYPTADLAVREGVGVDVELDAA